MKMKTLFSTCLSFGLVLNTIPGSANDDFQQWMRQQSQGVVAQKKEFQEYKDKRDKEFTAFLKAHWTAVDIVKGEVRDEAPKPEVMPVAPPMPVSSKPVAPPAVVSIPEPEVIKQAKPAHRWR